MFLWNSFKFILHEIKLLAQLDLDKWHGPWWSFVINPYTTAPTSSLRQLTLGQLSHSAAEDCLYRKLTQTQWGYCRVTVCCIIWVEWRLNLSVRYFIRVTISSKLIFLWTIIQHYILTASVKEYRQEAGSPEEVLVWAFMAIVVQLASLIFEKYQWNGSIALETMTKQDRG